MIQRSPQYRHIQQIRHKLLCFVNALQNHITSVALQGSWHRFQNELRTVRSMEELYRCHTKYLKRVEFLCILNLSSREFYDKIEDVFIIILRFCQWVFFILLLRKLIVSDSFKNVRLFSAIYLQRDGSADRMEFIHIRNMINCCPLKLILIDWLSTSSMLAIKCHKVVIKRKSVNSFQWSISMVIIKTKLFSFVWFSKCSKPNYFQCFN